MLFGATIRSHCPTRILQGMRDADVPYRHALTLVEHMAGDPVTLTLIKDGDHRLSRPQDLALLRDVDLLEHLEVTRMDREEPDEVVLLCRHRREERHEPLEMPSDPLALFG